MKEQTKQRVRIAIIDDDIWIREYLSQMLCDKGYIIDSADDDPAFLESIKNTPYDIIITDLAMRNFDGFHVLKTVKSLPHGPEVLLMTAHNSAENAVQALKSGAFDFLSKPLDSTRVEVAINQALERRRLKGEILRLQALSYQGGELEITADHLSFFDVLTGLPNRTLFFDRLEQAIARQRRQGNHLVVLCLDVDGFTRINEVHGSDIGDRLLAETARRLTSAAYERDTVARIGNDEFGVIAEIHKEQDVRQLVGKITAATSETVSCDDEEILLSLSIGAALYPADGGQSDQLVKNAGSALENAKGNGRGTFQFFTPEKHREEKEFIFTELLLSKGLADDNFTLHYQPYFDIHTLKPVGMEALLRWEGGKQKAMSPGQFIPILEKTKLIVPVGEWITHTICDFISRNRGLSLPVAMNISAAQLQRAEDVQRITDIIKAECPDPSMITVELTESLLLQDPETTRKAIASLKGIGCSISIDDFGTGYSSMSYLREFPFDNLKIDMSFIREIDANHDDQTIVAAIIAMAGAFQLHTIAEGVETEDQLKILRRIGSDISQGFYHARPMPEAQLLELLAAVSRYATAG